jgi:multidrug resistance efflux pump
MESAVKTLPARRSDLVLREMGDGQYVAKDPCTGTYFRLGEVEYGLLGLFDGLRTDEDIRQEFERRFGEPLSADDLRDFTDMVTKRGLIGAAPAAGRSAPTTAEFDDDEDDETTAATRAGKPQRQSWLYWRQSLFDPDRMLNWLEPKLRPVWTPAFLAVSLCVILFAGTIAWSNRFALTSSFAQAVRWETLVLVWLTLVLVTLCHEFAHGLTCKHFGGEVHEIGVMVMFFTPCFFCNVSDAWLMPRKSRRLWITLAGGYCDLCVWALAVFVWRVTMPGTLVNHLAWVVLSICGTRIFFNFNPLLKLDGYYLLSDWLEIPNLQKLALPYWMSHVRWLLWGAARPQRLPRRYWLLAYGITRWCFSLVFLEIVFFGLTKYLSSSLGLWSGVFTGLLIFLAVQRVFRGFFGKEFMLMITSRPIRTMAWVGGIAGVVALLFQVEIERTVSGSFQVRPGTRGEVHADVAGFLRNVFVDEGAAVVEGASIGLLEVPDLDSLITRKQAEVRESEANLRRLKAGARPQEIAEQRHRIQRAEAWCDLGRRDLERARQRLTQDLLRLDQEIAQRQTEFEFARTSLATAERLVARKALAGEQHRAEKKRYQVLQLQCDQAEAQKRAVVAEGTSQAEAEVARREKELADARAALVLLEAGSRPEEIEAEAARRTRLQEELEFLSSQRQKLKAVSPLAGIITTPFLHEKMGQYLEKGALICVVEDVSMLEAEIAIAEEDLQGVRPGQAIDLKTRALPFDTFHAQVDRVAASAANGAATATPAAGANLLQSTVRVYCKVDNPQALLRSGMTGFGRISLGRESIGRILVHRFLRYFRTEFWW